jgi:ETC complex I subunit conserved region
LIAVRLALGGSALEPTSRMRKEQVMNARLYQRPKNAMQSGHARTGDWLLEIERDEPQRPDPLTGWPGSGATETQVQLCFPTRDAALAYAGAQGLAVEIIPLGPVTLKLQAYADNFR